MAPISRFTLHAQDHSPRFTELLTDWEQHLAPGTWHRINDIVPGPAHRAMLAVGIIEIIAGVVRRPRTPLRRPPGRGWLAEIIINLLTHGRVLRLSASLLRSSWSAPSPSPHSPPTAAEHLCSETAASAGGFGNKPGCRNGPQASSPAAESLVLVRL